MRLIDADALLKDINDYPYGYRGMIKDTMAIQQTVDTIEVVRCKDCKWYKESNHSELYPTRFCYRLKNDDGVPVGYNWADNDFCSYGERRDKKTASYYGDNKLIETVVIDEREKDEAD